MNIAVEKPTNVRYGVLGFACVLSMITYLDRVCMNIIAPYIEKEFSLSDTQLGWLFGAFTLAYSVFEVPTGWLGDRFGPRKTLIRIVLWWSIFTVLTAAIYPTSKIVNFGFATINLGFLMLLVVRFLFGLGEAGAYPNIACAFQKWFPASERGRVKGAVWMAGRFAGGITPFVVLALLTETTLADGTVQTHWRHTFWIFGSLGLVWCVAFWIWFRDRPREKAGVNAAELALIETTAVSGPAEKLVVPWRRLLTNLNLWLLCAMYFCASYGWYFNITWLPRFLKQQFGLIDGAKFTATWWGFSLMAGLPLLFGSVACLAGGFLTDWFIRRTGNRRWGRRIFGMCGHTACALCYFAALAVIALNPAQSERNLTLAWMFALSVASAAFFNDMTMGSSWASCLDIGGKYSGIVSGCMNTIGNFGGFVANVLTGFILGSYTKHLPADIAKDSPEYFQASQTPWIINLALFGTVYVIAVVLWSRFDASKPVVPEAVGRAPEPASPIAGRDV